MNSDSNDHPDDTAATSEAQGHHGEPENTSPGECGPARSPDAYKRAHLGRQSWDRWMLHKTLLEDFAEDMETECLPPPQTSPPAPENKPDGRSP